MTGTASGKTLCYNLPILESCLKDPKSRALYLFPTKALAQDQLKGQLELLAGSEQVAAAIKPGVFDGDTPTAQRRRIKAEVESGAFQPRHAARVDSALSSQMESILRSVEISS